MAERLRLRIRGLVQGVGFRPHVYRQAVERGITGFALNDGEGVLIEAEGPALEDFVQAVRELAPPLARIDSLTRSTLPVEGESEFSIRESSQDGAATAAIPADVALCDECLEELFDPANRRYGHPFIACTNCGPRVTMTRRLPYDRDSTTMGDFPLCGACETEYTDPGSRRFHAEPIACHDCGPQLSVPVEEIAAALAAGKIVALKGIGGYHLVCNAHDGELVETLRRRKQRDQKPFAVMVPNLASATRHARLSDAARDALASRQRPVVVVQRKALEPLKPAANVVPSEADNDGLSGDSLPVALGPGLDSLGLMLPYTAVHYLLFHALLGAPEDSDWIEAAHDIALVMTSANVSGKPLVSTREEAERELAGIADLLVHHDRHIARPTDDSVVRDVGNHCVPIRRARGRVPGALRLRRDGPVVIACGAHLKNTVTVTRGDLAYPSTHVGDLGTAESLRFQARAVEQLVDMLDVRPRRIACDWHPDYGSTRLAEALAERFDAPLVRVQHHHAHIAALLAEHRVDGPVLGVALDGHGMGERGEAWGGELLRVDGGVFERLGHFRPLPAIGGDRAAREPWRLAAGVLAQLGRAGEIEARFGRHANAAALAGLLDKGVGQGGTPGSDPVTVPHTTAAGRLFDAASALLGVCEVASFEGQAPMLLETKVRFPRPLDGGFVLENGVLDFRPLLDHLTQHDDDRGAGADCFHGTLLAAITRWVRQAANDTGLDTVALGGGCMINRVLAVGLPAALEAAGLTVLTARRMPPNDAAISLGQAWVAARSDGRPDPLSTPIADAGERQTPSPATA